VRDIHTKASICTLKNNVNNWFAYLLSPAKEHFLLKKNQKSAKELRLLIFLTDPHNLSPAIDFLWEDTNSVISIYEAFSKHSFPKECKTCFSVSFLKKSPGNRDFLPLQSS